LTSGFAKDDGGAASLVLQFAGSRPKHVAAERLMESIGEQTSWEGDARSRG